MKTNQKIRAFVKQSCTGVNVIPSSPLYKHEKQLSYKISLLVNLDVTDDTKVKYFCSSILYSPTSGKSWVDSKVFLLSQMDYVKAYMAIATNILEKHHIYAFFSSKTTSHEKIEKEINKWQKSLD